MIKKSIFLSLILFIVSGFVFSQNAPLKFDHSVKKFGKVDEGVKVEIEYIFVNNGEKPLIINDTKVNCACTVVDFPKSPIKPNEKGAINVSFDTHGKIGYQERKIEIITNQGTTTIVFKGVVKATEETLEEHKHQENN